MASGSLNARPSPDASARARHATKRSPIFTKPSPFVWRCARNVACRSPSKPAKSKSPSDAGVAATQRPRSRKGFRKGHWQIARQRGSHIVLVKDGHIATLSVPGHREVAKGTLRGLIRASDRPSKPSSPSPNVTEQIAGLGYWLRPLFRPLQGKGLRPVFFVFLSSLSNKTRHLGRRPEFISDRAPIRWTARNAATLLMRAYSLLISYFGDTIRV